MDFAASLSHYKGLSPTVKPIAILCNLASISLLRGLSDRQPVIGIALDEESTVSETIPSRTGYADSAWGDSGSLGSPDSTIAARRYSRLRLAMKRTLMLLGQTASHSY